MSSTGPTLLGVDVLWAATLLTALAAFSVLVAVYAALSVRDPMAKRVKALNDRREQLKAGITASTSKRRAKLVAKNETADRIRDLILHSPSGVSFEVKIACIRALDKDFLPQAAPAVAQTAGSGRIRPRSRCFLAQGRRFSAQRTDLSSRFRSV